MPIMSCSSSMSDDAEFSGKRPFLDPGRCKVPNCEVAITIEKQPIYVCKQILVHKSQFFQTLFHGDFKEKHDGNFELKDVTLEEILLFLECTMLQPKRPIPSDVDSLVSLIRLAGQFMCDSLQYRIGQHILTMSSSTSADTKLAVLAVADKHRGVCPAVLSAAVRLCATLPLNKLLPFSCNVSGTVMAAIYEIKLTSIPNSMLMPLCPRCQSDKVVPSPRKNIPSPSWYCKQCHEFTLADDMMQREFADVQLDWDTCKKAQVNESFLTKKHLFADLGSIFFSWFTSKFTKYEWFGMGYLARSYRFVFSKICVMSAWHAALLQFAAVAIMALNRCTAIGYPQKHEEIWTNKVVIGFIILQWFGPMVAICPMFWMQFDMDMNNITGEISSCYFACQQCQQYYFTGIVIYNWDVNVLTISLYSLSFWRIRNLFKHNAVGPAERRNENIRKTEIRLSVMGLLLSLILLIYGFNLLIQATVAVGNLEVCYMSLIAWSFINDIFRWCNPWLCLICSPEIRRHMWALVTGKSQQMFQEQTAVRVANRNRKQQTHRKTHQETRM